jgi:hypothetical protein
MQYSDLNHGKPNQQNRFGDGFWTAPRGEEATMHAGGLELGKWGKAWERAPVRVECIKKSANQIIKLVLTS